jgi:CopG family transcriptional regulator/antitoxin EndoAI
MHQRINITLAAETIALMDRITGKGNRSRFIAAAVEHYAAEAYRKELKERLQEGALRRAERDRRLAEEWFALEEEICQEKPGP